MGSTATILEGNNKRSIWTKFWFLFQPVVLKKILKNVKFFKHSEAMSAILDEGKGHQTQF
jgi:hypothetical protein